MEKFAPQKFNIPELKGISAKNIEEHLKLYEGYVKNANLVLSMIEQYSPLALSENPPPDGVYGLSEVRRRFAFEFDGMRNHEYYFASFEGGQKALSDGDFKTALEKEFGSYDKFLAMFKGLAMTRGVGWAMLYYDWKSKKLLTHWVDEQHLGQLTGICPILCLDMWEHAFVYDYPTSEKKKYVDAFFENLNWGVIEQNFKDAQ